MGAAAVNALLLVLWPPVTNSMHTWECTLAKNAMVFANQLFIIHAQAGAEAIPAQTSAVECATLYMAGTSYGCQQAVVGNTPRHAFVWVLRGVDITANLDE